MCVRRLYTERVEGHPPRFRYFLRARFFSPFARAGKEFIVSLPHPPVRGHVNLPKLLPLLYNIQDEGNNLN